MNYLQRQQQNYRQAEPVNWARIGLPADCFPQLNDVAFAAIDLEQQGALQIVDLKALLNGQSTVENLTTEQLMQYLAIDANQAESFGNKFCAYINGGFNHGQYLRVKAGQSASLKLNYQLSAEQPLLVDHHLIIAEAGAELNVVLDYRSLDQTQQQHYGSIKVIAAEYARVNLTILQRLNDASYSFQQIFTQVDEAADVIFNDAQIGATVKAVSCIQQVAGLRANATTNSLYFGQENSATDVAYTTKHSGKKSTSAIFSKGALKENSKKVFRGNLAFARGATKAVGREEEFVLLLSEKLKADSMPGLFCQEDDVIGEHAASVGQIDQNKLFYMMSRGFDEAEAKRLMIHSGYAEVIQKMKIGDLGAIISAELDERIN